MSIQFDNLETKACPIDTGPVNVTTCEVTPPAPPSDDEKCLDPEYAATHPECAGFPQLILKPEYAIIAVGDTQQYKTYLRVQGVETEITLGLSYAVADVTIAMIGNTSGLATGSSSGIVTVSVTWQNLSAHAQLEVVNSCADTSQHFLILIDNSKSMNQGFSALNATKLAFAKDAAVNFINSVNFTKDKVTVAYFSQSGTIAQVETTVAADAVAAVNGIASSNGKTFLYNGLKTAIDYLTSLNVSDGAKVVILFTDGEDNGDTDPIPLANTFKSTGGIILVVACRAWGNYFAALAQITSDGFFLSAYEATEAAVKQTLVGLKAFICSGDCSPTAGTYPTSELHYFGFINWDVTKGDVDLIGLGDGSNQDAWDLLPGNGLYVDMNGGLRCDTPNGMLNCFCHGQMVAGTCIEKTKPTTNGPGQLTSKTDFTFSAGDYRFKIDIAPANRGVYSQVYSKITLSIGTFFEEIVEFDPQTPEETYGPFVTYTYLFTLAAPTTGKIVIDLFQNPNGLSGLYTATGPLVDNVVLERLDVPTTMLTDDFNNENPTTIPAGYGGYYGCLVTPPGAQQADPTPPTPPVVE